MTLLVNKDNLYIYELYGRILVANGDVWLVVLLSQWNHGAIVIYSEQLDFIVSEMCLVYMWGY